MHVPILTPIFNYNLKSYSFLSVFGPYTEMDASSSSSSGLRPRRGGLGGGLGGGLASKKGKHFLRKDKSFSDESDISITSGNPDD